MICEECGKSFIPVKSWQVNCSSRCRSNKANKNRKEKAREYSKLYKHTPVARYNVHKQTSARRGIKFNLSFSDWWGIWKALWDKRGRSKTSLVMCRYGDKGAYELGNVYIDTYSNNSALGARLQNQNRDTITGRFISENN